MDHIFIPLLNQKISADRLILEQVFEISRSANSLEQLIHYWVSEKRSLIVFRSAEFNPESVSFIFRERQRELAIINIGAEELISRYSEYEPLNETILQFSDQPGYRPDDLWFEERNKRLGIYKNKKLRINTVPSKSCGALILNYSLSSKGQAQISLLNTTQQEYRWRYLKLSLTFMEEESLRGWSERVALSRMELAEMVAPKVAMQRAEGT